MRKDGGKEREGKVEEEVRGGQEKVYRKKRKAPPPPPSPPNMQFSSIRGQD